MNNVIQNDAEMKQLKHEKCFGFNEAAPDDNTTMLEDPDTLVSMFVLLLVCFALAGLAHIFV